MIATFSIRTIGVAAICSISAAPLILTDNPVQAAAEKKAASSTDAAAAAGNRSGRQQPPGKKTKATAEHAPALTMTTFLDRLMIAESGGRDAAANPRSSARGPFQFIKATFLKVARRHFSMELAKLSNAQILALRLDRAFARKSAAAYTRDNAAYLASHGHRPTFLNLRLAFLLGPFGASRILQAKPNVPLVRLISPAALKANPFMRRMTVADLKAKTARDLRVSQSHDAGVAIKPGAKQQPKRPHIKIRCNLGLPSCRRWLALKRRRLQRLERRKNLHRRRPQPHSTTQ